MKDVQQTDIQNVVVDYIRNHAPAEGLTIDETTNFVESGLLDSFAILSLIMTLECQFSVKFQTQELADPGLRTIGVLARTIFEKMPKS